MLSELVKIGEIEREEEWKRVQEKGKRERERENYYRTIAIYNAVTV